MTTVLIVDDVAPMAEQYAYDLQRLGGYDTVTASSGDEALERVRREAIDCVILDLEMPGVDGFQVLRTMARRGIGTPCALRLYRVSNTVFDSGQRHRSGPGFGTSRAPRGAKSYPGSA